MGQLEALRESVGAIEARLLAIDEASAGLLAAVPAEHRSSARNFIQYVTIRQTDLRALQSGLFRYGLSSLGRVEGHVLDAIIKVRERLDDVIECHGDARTEAGDPPAPPTWDDAERLLHAHTRALLGPRPAHRHVSIMVTAPASAEADIAWVERLLDAGMNVLRVNTAHEDERAWARICSAARAAAEERHVHLTIAVDLPGPKLRTVMLQEGTRVAKWKPERDELGRVTAPCRVTLGPSSTSEGPGGHLAILPDAIWPALAVGDELAFDDARGKSRRLTIVELGPSSGIGEIRATAYVVPGMRMTLERGGASLGDLTLGEVPARRSRLSLSAGDRFCIVKHGAVPPEGMPAVGCTLDAALASLEVGHRVLFDDGHLEAVAEEVAADHVLVRVTYAAGRTFRLAAEKGINLPDSELTLPLFAEDDERALAFAVHHADVVGASFVRGPDDVRELHRRLAELRADRVGLVLKIETTGAFARLPAILLAALERAPVGVMIARGDLAIESGYERLAELQEQIL